MADIQPPPTFAEVVLTDPKTQKAKFNPIWLNWFLVLVQTINDSGGTTLNHNDLNNIQGGSASERYHLTSAQLTSLLTLLGLNITVGTWTPTLTNVTNLAASTAYLSTYLRVSNVVIGFGRVDVDPTAAGAAQLGISLPVASNFANAYECAGVAFAPAIAGQGAAILGDATNNRAEMDWIAVDITNQPMYWIFGYRVI